MDFGGFDTFHVMEKPSQYKTTLYGEVETRANF